MTSLEKTRFPITSQLAAQDSRPSCPNSSSVDDCDEVGTGTVGDDDLAEKLAELAEEGIGEIDYDDLSKLETAYLGDEISDYLEPESENELRGLDRLIEAAKVLVE